MYSQYTSFNASSGLVSFTKSFWSNLADYLFSKLKLLLYINNTILRLIRLLFVKPQRLIHSLLKFSETLKHDSTFLDDRLPYILVHDFRPPPASLELCCWFRPFSHGLTESPSPKGWFFWWKWLGGCSQTLNLNFKAKNHWLGKKPTWTQGSPQVSKASSTVELSCMTLTALDIKHISVKFILFYS